jgi:hypothetical protein
VIEWFIESGGIRQNPAEIGPVSVGHKPLLRGLSGQITDDVNLKGRDRQTLEIF